jgi:hypothetical protein
MIKGFSLAPSLGRGRSSFHQNNLCCHNWNVVKRLFVMEKKERSRCSIDDIIAKIVNALAPS